MFAAGSIDAKPNPPALPVSQGRLAALPGLLLGDGLVVLGLAGCAGGPQRQSREALGRP